MKANNSCIVILNTLVTMDLLECFYVTILGLVMVGNINASSISTSIGSSTYSDSDSTYGVISHGYSNNIDNSVQISNINVKNTDSNVKYNPEGPYISKNTNTNHRMHGDFNLNVNQRNKMTSYKQRHRGKTSPLLSSISSSSKVFFNHQNRHSASNILDGSSDSSAASQLHLSKEYSIISNKLHQEEGSDSLLKLGLNSDISDKVDFDSWIPHHIERRDTSSSSVSSTNPQKLGEQLVALLRNDTKLAVLHYINYLQVHKDCQFTKPSVISTSVINSTIPDMFYSLFKSQMDAAIRTSNTLSNVFKTWDIKNGTLYVDNFYYAMARSLVESNTTIYGTVIAFEGNEYINATKHKVFFAPMIYRETDKKKDPGIKAVDLAKRSNNGYAANASGYEWFQRLRHPHNELLWKFNGQNNVCKSYNSASPPSSQLSIKTAITTASHGQWFGPTFNCVKGFPQEWVMSYSVPFFGCRENSPNYNFKGVVNVKIDLDQVDINQCSHDPSRPFSDTHRCNRTSTKCIHKPGYGFQRGSYTCQCKDGFYPNDTTSSNHEGSWDGSEVEQAYVAYVLGQESSYTKFYCLPCKAGCEQCTNGSACLAAYDIIIRGVPLGITSFCMTIALVIAFSLFRLRKSKVMKASFWLLLEIFIFGALLLYSTIIIQYFVPTKMTCLLIPWFREVGFAIFYGALVLKVYRVLAEFQSRKAHRVHVRDKDLLKWLFCIVCVVIGYMSAWTALNLEHIKEDGSSMLMNGTTQEHLHYHICKSNWWDILIEIGEFIYLCFGIYLCYCIRSAPSDYLETRYISWAIYNETFISAILHIARHILWLITNPDYIFLMYFIRCQMTVTVNLALVLGPKIYYSHRPPEDEAYRNRAYSTSDVQDNILPESVKLHVGVNSNGDVDVAEINLAEMDPEDIRAELKRLYTQLQIYKTKTMRKDNPHISKRRGGRKHTHRRFSLQAFHNKHRHHHPHTHHPSQSEVSMDHDTEMSRTPEESTNSNEGYGCSIEESTCSVAEVRTPTVTFKPGHKTIYSS